MFKIIKNIFKKNEEQLIKDTSVDMRRNQINDLRKSINECRCLLNEFNESYIECKEEHEQMKENFRIVAHISKYMSENFTEEDLPNDPLKKETLAMANKINESSKQQ
jgi:hypothetical protein